MSEWVLDEAETVSIELVLYRLQNFRACRDRAFDYPIDIGEVQIQAHHPQPAGLVTDRDRDDECNGTGKACFGITSAWHRSR
jgi:hypothetical protein